MKSKELEELDQYFNTVRLKNQPSTKISVASKKRKQM